MRFYITSDRYIMAEVVEDPPIPSGGVPDSRNGWLVNAQRPVNDLIQEQGGTVRYSLDELMVEEWGPEALERWQSGDDSRHEDVVGLRHVSLVRQSLEGMAHNDPRAAELLSGDHSFPEQAAYAAYFEPREPFLDDHGRPFS